MCGSEVQVCLEHQKEQHPTGYNNTYIKAHNPGHHAPGSPHVPKPTWAQFSQSSTKAFDKVFAKSPTSTGVVILRVSA